MPTTGSSSLATPAGPGNHDFFTDRVFPPMGRVMTTDDAVAAMEYVDL
jgi:hypothetical protein